MIQEITNNIPKGWIKTKLSEVAYFVNGKPFKSQHWRDKGKTMRFETILIPAT